MINNDKRAYIKKVVERKIDLLAELYRGHLLNNLDTEELALLNRRLSDLIDLIEE